MAVPLTRTLLRNGKTVALSLAVLITIRDRVVAVDMVKGSSMSPALSPLSHETGVSDRVIIRRWKPAEGLHRGDVITFWKPHKQGEISIKRVIGLPGDVVVPRDRETGTRGGYGGHGVRGNYAGVRDAGDGGEGGLVVPMNHVWVEGDNWRGSLDSNDFGPVSMALVDGKAWKVIRRWSVLDVPILKLEKGRTRVRAGREV